MARRPSVRTSVDLLAVFPGGAATNARHKVLKKVDTDVAAHLGLAGSSVARHSELEELPGSEPDSRNPWNTEISAFFWAGESRRSCLLALSTAEGLESCPAAERSA